MADTSSEITQAAPEPLPDEKRREQALLWHRLALGGIILISIFMNFFQLGRTGFGTYYPPAVRSMMDNWHNFFFSSYDPGGFVSIDKPPVGFWLQVISAKIFGFTPFSVLLPQALAGVLAVLVLYYLIRHRFGVVAGLLAALALALSPISIVTNRDVTIDSTLALVLLLGAWTVIHAAETGQLRWLLLSAVIVGIGFNIKMMEAYLVVPAFGVLYLLAAPKSIWKRIGHLVLAAMVLLVVSFSWAVAVDLTPASQRPYVGSTQDNSEISLALGYNGINRLIGGFGRGFRGGTRTNANNRPANGGGNGAAPFPGGPPANAGRNGAPTPPPNGGGFGGIFATGTPGPLRLFVQPLAGQIAWLLPLALLGILALAWQRRPHFQSDHQQQAMLFWGMWVLTMGAFFSVASFFHQYYMTEMAPGIAALVGIGLVTMWQDYQRGDWRGWLLPIALLLTFAEQIYILANYPAWGWWMIPTIAILGFLSIAWSVITRIGPDLGIRFLSMRLLAPAITVGILALMIAPTIWAAIPIFQGTRADLLVAGPIQQDGFGGRAQRNNARGGNIPRGGDELARTDPALIRYLEDNQGSAKFLVATSSSMTADGFILATNKPVMAMGGFSGSDPILTPNQLASLVSQGTVRFFFINTRIRIPQQILNQIPQQFRARIQQGGGFGGFGQQAALTSWITKHCTAVPASQWQSPYSNADSGGGFGPFGASQLYDCAPTS